MKKCPTIFNSAPIMDIQQMKISNNLKKKAQMDTYLRENYQEKKRNIIYGKNHSKKTISATMQKLKPIFALWEKFYTEEKHTNTKTNKE